MGDVALRVEGLGKQYRLGAAGPAYGMLRDQLSLRKLWRRARAAQERPSFWALKDINFEVKRGEVVGVIGRNGAGKSTLLKILSRITEPTEGGADIHGRVGSLLEVGTGFHPELTGRENIALNGAILGMKRAEVRRKFDDIVAFAEIEKFIDTPVKHYSSGMYTRLAFAVAAHLEPDILIVDEVLAVGDAQFQKKCLGRMGEVAKGGRTVLFVSHQIAAVRAMCSRVVLLDGGSVAHDGEVDEALDLYFSKSAGSEIFQPKSNENDDVHLLKASLTQASVDRRKPFDVVCEIEVRRELRGMVVGIMISSLDGVIVCGSANRNSDPVDITLAGHYTVVCSVPAHLLNVMDYNVTIGVVAHPARQVFLHEECLRLSVSVDDGHGTNFTRPPGVVWPQLHWREFSHAG